MRVSCSCGKVEFEATGAPIAAVACYCDDCQEGSRRIEALPNAPPVRDEDGATEYLLYRRDRFKCSKGRELLQDCRLQEKSPTKRVVAGCCNSAMHLDFEKGHWLSSYRSRFTGEAPPLEMRVQTRFMPTYAEAQDNIPAYRGLPFQVISKLLLARIAMLLPW
jgi:hypothetical protein